MDVNKVYQEDCLVGLAQLETNSVNMVMTSPPYALQRKNAYGGVNANEYKEWFMPVADQIMRVLTNDGSFFLNLKSHSVKGFRHIYVLDLVVSLVKEQHWGLVDTICWTKNSFPRKPQNKFKNAWEPIYHFSKNKDIKFYPERVMIPMSEKTKERIKYSEPKQLKNESPLGKPGDMRFDNFQGKKMAYPTNVIDIKNSTTHDTLNRWHPAKYPFELAEWFIKVYTDEGDLVCDPFAGSGTTLWQAKKMNRNYIGFEIWDKYCNQIESKMGLEVVYA